MILLRDAVEIEVSVEQVYDWLAHFQENYVAWHSDHVECRYLTGASLEPGAVLYAKEYLHGQPHHLKFRVTRVVPNSLVEYAVSPGIAGVFEIERRGNRAFFIAEISIGLQLPVIGGSLDWLLLKLFSDRLDVLKQHMAEEGRNLKVLLERNAHEHNRLVER